MTPYPDGRSISPLCETPEFKRLLRIVLAAVAIGLLAIAGVRIADYIAVDRCLDSGGRWNHHIGACEQ
jgi:hypothetical protein